MIRVRVDFSLGGIECRWWACLCAGALKGVPVLVTGVAEEIRERKGDEEGLEMLLDEGSAGI